MDEETLHWFLTAYRAASGREQAICWRITDIHAGMPEMKFSEAVRLAPRLQVMDAAFEAGLAKTLPGYKPCPADMSPLNPFLGEEMTITTGVNADHLLINLPVVGLLGPSSSSMAAADDILSTILNALFKKKGT